MTKYEKIFNGLLTPIKVSNSLYKCETFLYSRTLEENKIFLKDLSIELLVYIRKTFNLENIFFLKREIMK